MFHISTQRPILCSHFSSLIPILHSMYTLYWNALPYIGKFDGQTAFGIYGLAANYGHNNTNQALQPCCNTHHTMRLRLIYGYGQSMVTVNLRLRPIYGYGQYTVTANIQLRPIYGCGHSILLLRPLYPLQLQLCYI